MAARIMVLNLTGASAQNWDLCVENQMIAAKDKRTPRVAPGDDIFVYVSQPRPALIGHMLALGDKQSFNAPSDAPWHDGATYLDFIPVEVITNLEADRVDVTWSQLQSVGGFAGQANTVPKIVDPAKIAALRQLVGTDPSVIEEVTRGVLDAPQLKEDLRERGRREVVRRQGQRAFRNMLLTAYSSTCAVTGTAEPSVLEAAHIHRYMGPHSNIASNGLLLRADIHTLFDLFLMTIKTDGQHYDVVISPTVVDPGYANLAGRLHHLPTAAGDRPSPTALADHNRDFDDAERARAASAAVSV